MKFKIGDIVEAVADFENGLVKGKRGKVICVRKNDIGVEFFENVFTTNTESDIVHMKGHTCGGKGEYGHCWWVATELLIKDDVLELIERTLE